jgi:hypothetical protein
VSRAHRGALLLALAYASFASIGLPDGCDEKPWLQICNP